MALNAFGRYRLSFSIECREASSQHQPFTIIMSSSKNNRKTERPKSYSTKPKDADRAAGATSTAGTLVAEFVEASGSLDIVLIVCRACQVERDGL